MPESGTVVIQRATPSFLSDPRPRRGRRVLAPRDPDSCPGANDSDSEPGPVRPGRRAAAVAGPRRDLGWDAEGRWTARLPRRIRTKSPARDSPPRISSQARPESQARIQSPARRAGAGPGSASELCGHGGPDKSRPRLRATRRRRHLKQAPETSSGPGAAGTAGAAQAPGGAHAAALGLYPQLSLLRILERRPPGRGRLWGCAVILLEGL